jgi:hypothetical protein
MTEWLSQAELMQFYKTLVLLYQLIHELKKSRKLDNEKFEAVCKTLGEIINTPSLKASSKKTMQSEFDLCLNELWRIAKHWCLETPESDDLLHVYEAVHAVMQIPNAGYSPYHYLRMAHLSQAVSQHGTALGMYASHLKEREKEGFSYNPFNFSEAVLSQLFLIMANEFKLKVQPAFNVTARKIWPYGHDGMSLKGAFICLTESRCPKKDALEKALKAIENMTIPSLIVNLPEEQRVNPQAPTFAKLHQFQIQLIFDWLKRVEAHFPLEWLDTLDNEALKDNVTVRKIEEMQLFFTVKEQMMFKLRDVLTKLEQKVHLLRVTYRLPEGFEADLKTANDTIRRLDELLGRSDQAKKDEKEVKTADKKADEKAREKERAKAEQEKAKLERERKEAAKKEALEKKKAQDDAKSLLKQKEVQQQRAAERLKQEEAIALVKKEQEKKAAEAKAEKEKKEAAAKAAQEAAAKAAAKAAQETAAKAAALAPRKLSPPTTGLTMYPIQLTAKLSVDDANYTISEIVPSGQPSVFATNPEKILEMLQRATEGWTLGIGLVSNLIKFNDYLHQINIETLEADTKKIIATFAHRKDRETAVTDFFHQYGIDQVAVMKGVIAKAKESEFTIRQEVANR